VVRRGVAVVPERGAQVGVAVEVALLVEGVGGAPLGLAEQEVVLLAGGGVGAQRLDQVAVPGEVALVDIVPSLPMAVAAVWRVVGWSLARSASLPRVDTLAYHSGRAGSRLA
jgi:hypothetical protein